jgi:hypothetical protein
MSRVLYPESPGIEGWVDSVRQALEQVEAAARR